MIKPEHIEEWQEWFPWFYEYQVEQDLVLSKTIVLIFNDEYLAPRLVMLGGTAIYKLIYMKSIRYSNDIDFALAESVPKNEIHRIISRIREILELWLGKPKVRVDNRVAITFKFKSSDSSSIDLKLKLDIDTVENFSVMEYRNTQFTVQNGYFSGSATVRTLQLEECFAKKMRALGDLSRRKGRDLFDFWYALKYEDLNVTEVLNCFQTYMKKSGKDFSKEHYESVLKRRLKDPVFRNDTDDLIVNFPDWNIDNAAIEFDKFVISKLPSRI